MTFQVTSRYVDQTSGANINKTTDIVPTEDTQLSGRVTVGTVEVNVDRSTEISANGWMMFLNRGPTDTLRVGLATGDYIWELRPGETVLHRLDSSKAFNFFVVSNGTTDKSNFEFYLRND